MHCSKLTRNNNIIQIGSGVSSSDVTLDLTLGHWKLGSAMAVSHCLCVQPDLRKRYGEWACLRFGKMGETAFFKSFTLYQKWETTADNSIIRTISL
jgi:hypothetical protein